MKLTPGVGARPGDRVEKLSDAPARDDRAVELRVPLALRCACGNVEDLPRCARAHPVSRPGPRADARVHIGLARRDGDERVVVGIEARVTQVLRSECPWTEAPSSAFPWKGPRPTEPAMRSDGWRTPARVMREGIDHGCGVLHQVRLIDARLLEVGRGIRRCQMAGRSSRREPAGRSWTAAHYWHSLPAGNAFSAKSSVKFASSRSVRPERHGTAELHHVRGKHRC